MGKVSLVRPPASMRICLVTFMKILCGIQNAEFEHVYCVELQGRNIRLSFGTSDYCKCSHALIQ